MAMDKSNRGEDVRAVIKRFHDLVFSERDLVRKLDWIHARVRDTCRLVEPPQGEIKKFKSELDHARKTDFADMARDHECTVEEVIEHHRPKPSLEWRPLFCSSERNQAPDLSDCVFLLAVLHDSIGPYRETPMKPDLAADGDDKIVRLRWEMALDDLPRPEDRIQDWEPPSWFVHHVAPRIDEWFKRVQEAFALEFWGADQVAESGSAGAAGQPVGGGEPPGEKGTSAGAGENQDLESPVNPKQKPLPLPRLLAFKAAQLAERIAGTQLTDPVAHKNLKDDPATEAALSADPDLKDYEVPEEQRTFARYLTDARKHFGCPRKMPRKGRAGRSLVHLDGSRSDQ